MSSDEHDWFADHAAAYAMDGLSVDERARLELHAAGCDPCATTLAALKKTDQTMTQLFASLRPTAGFEASIIDRLNQSMRPSPQKINPLVRRAAVAAAAAIVLGGFGYVASEKINTGKFHAFAFVSSADQPVTAGAVTDALSNAKKLDYGGGTSAAHDWVNWNGETSKMLAKEKYSNADPDAAGRVASSSNHATASAGPGDGNDSILLPDDKKTSLVEKDELKATHGIPLADTRRVSAPALPSHFEPSFNEAAKAGELASGDLLDTEKTPPTAVAASVPPSLVLPSASSTPPETPSPAAPHPFQRKVIRNGKMNFIVDSFDSAYLQVAAIVAEEGGFIGTTDSQKLPNGKVSGAITIRIAPDHLDVLVLKLRALGELKEQKITAEDITKQYTDLGSELRAARAMEDRLLELIKDGKGSIKDLLAAEKELGEWREKIEKISGQVNYFDNLVALSTLQLTLTEKDIKTPALASDTETVDMGVEAEDVAKARADAITAVDDAQGRIVESELKQLDAGQFAAKVVADIPSDKSGPVIDRLKQLGAVSRLDVQRQQVTTDGQGNPVNADTLPAGVRVERNDTRLTLSFYNLANVAPRQTINVELACDDVDATYHAILEQVSKVGGRVLSSNLNRPTPDQVTGTVSFEVKSIDADGMLANVKQAGDLIQSNAIENADTTNVTSSKRGFSVQLRSIASVNPREVRTVSLAASDVTVAYDKLLTALSALKARIILSKLDNEQDASGNPQNQTAGWIDFEVKRSDIDAAERAVADAGDSIQRSVLRSTDDQNTLDMKVQIKVGLHNVTLLPPRESWTLAVECAAVESAQADLVASANTAGGRVIDSAISKEASGTTTAHLVIDVPLHGSAVLIDRVQHLGDLRVIQSSKNPQAPDGKLARSRLEISIVTPESIVTADHGLWGTIRAGLTTSVTALLWSLQLIVVGLCVAGPFAAAIWLGWRLVVKRKKIAT